MNRESTRRVRYRVDWLEMQSRPTRPAAQVPVGENITLTEAENFPQWFFFAMYDAVGQNYDWEDMHHFPSEDVNRLLDDEKTRMFTMGRHGWPQGFFLLDLRTEFVSDIAYFGLVEQAIGKRLGGWLLDQALKIGWESNSVKKMTVNTCTLDHRRARQLYESRGFRLARSAYRERFVSTERPQLK